MKRAVSAVAAVLALATLAGDARAHHPCLRYAGMPVYGGGGFSMGYSYGVPAMGYGYSLGVPAYGYSYGFGAPAFGFGAPALGYGAPAMTLSLTPGYSMGGFGTGADAQGVFDQILLPLLLRQFLGGGGISGGGMRVQLSDADVKKLGDAISNSSRLNTVAVRLDNQDKRIKAIMKKLDVADPPDIVPVPPQSAAPVTPGSDLHRAELRAVLAEVDRKQAAMKADAVAAGAETDRQRAELRSILAEVEAKQGTFPKADTTRTTTSVTVRP
jgi:hypothetical protein